MSEYKDNYLALSVSTLHSKYNITGTIKYKDNKQIHQQITSEEDLI